MTKRRIYLSIVLLFCSQITFGQTKIENTKGTKGIATGGYKPNRQETPPQNININYNDRAYQNDCYKNFAFTVKNYGYNKDGKFYSWGVKVRNNYSKPVQLKYKLTVGNDNTSSGTLTYFIKPSETYSNDFGTVKAIIVKSNSDQFRIEVSQVCFEGQDCNKNGYLDCNGKQKPENSNQEKSATNSEESETSNVLAASITFDKNKDAKDFANTFVSLLKNQGFNYQNAEYDSYVGNNFPHYYTFSEFKITMDYKNAGEWPNYTQYISEIRLSEIVDKRTCEKLQKIINCAGNTTFNCTIYCLEKNGIIYMKMK